MPETIPSPRYKAAIEALHHQREALIARLGDEKPLDFMEQNTRILDDYFRESFETSEVGPEMGITVNPYVIVALGGYGRKEQCVHSDVDILFLFKKDIPRQAESLIREVIYPLWDIGMSVGHATRSLKECVSLAGRDVEVLTALLDARFICGMSLLYSELMQQVQEKIIFRRSHKIIEWHVAATEARHGRYGDSAHLLEPNLKEGQGGLRDYHAMLWLGRIRSHVVRPRDLVYHGYLSMDEFDSLQKSLGFLWRVRNDLHVHVGRKYDQLHFEYQIALSEKFGYGSDETPGAVERFLTDLHGRMDGLKQSLRIFLQQVGKRPKWFAFAKKNRNPSLREGFEYRKETLGFSSSEAVLHHPVRLLTLFEESARLKIPVSPEARRLVKEFSFLMDDAFRASPSVVRIMERILALPSSEGLTVLEDMRCCGALTRLIPEFGAVVNRMQYGAYHVFPVDKHLFHTVSGIKNLAAAQTPDDLSAKIYEEMTDIRPLLWAALLHDIGKGLPDADHAEAGAVMAETILARFGYAPDFIGTVSFLVRRHRDLITIATRRDIDEEETVLACARIVSDPSRLKMLYLLTCADRIATGPRAWSHWTHVLVRDLFLRTLKVLSVDDSPVPDAGGTPDAKISAIFSGLSADSARKEAEVLLQVMSPRYLQAHSVSDILTHMDLFPGLKTRPFVWKIIPMPDSRTRRIILLARNRHGLFSQIAGILAIHRIEVLEAQVYTWRNHTAVFGFTVNPPPDLLFEKEKWDRTERELLSAFSGKLNVSEAMIGRMALHSRKRLSGIEPRPSVRVDNGSSRSFTLIEVHAPDSPGLLYRLTESLTGCELDVWSARIHTIAERAVDVFYVRNYDGRRIEAAEQIEKITDALYAVLSEPEDLAPRIQKAQ